MAGWRSHGSNVWRDERGRPLNDDKDWWVKAEPDNRGGIERFMFFYFPKGSLAGTC